MKAIVLNQPKNFAVKEIELPELKEDEVLIRIKDSGICTNDVRDFTETAVTATRGSAVMSTAE